MKKLRVVTLWFQSVYTLLTALWPIVDIESFMWVSGYKVDVWLVKTVSILLLAVAVCLLLAIFSKGDHFPVYMLALLAAAGLAYVDFYYALGGRISKIYMADGVIEALFVLAWLFILSNQKKKPAEAGIVKE